MYKVTLFDGNTAPYISNTFSVYCDDIDEFEKNWSEMETVVGCVAATSANI